MPLRNRHRFRDLDKKLENGGKNIGIHENGILEAISSNVFSPRKIFVNKNPD